MLHQNIPPSFIHGIAAWYVADATALAAIAPIVDDIGKVAVQFSPYDVFILRDATGPVWMSLLTPAALAAGNVTVVDAGGYYTGDNVEAILQEIGLSLGLARDSNIWAIAFSDETTSIAAGTSKATFHAPFDATVLEVFVGLTVAQASGPIFTVDVNKNGVTILSTTITVDNTETTSLTAATPPVISVSAVAKGDSISVDVDQIGTAGAKGGKLYMRVRRTS